MPSHAHPTPDQHTAPPAPPADPLQRERAHLAASRSALRAMREDAENLNIANVTANWVNAEVLQGEIDARIKALADLAHTPLFFGRLDYLHAPGMDLAEGATGENFYVGRRHVHDADGDPMVIDWRAPVSQPFYRASKKDPMDLKLRRRFGYTAGELTAYEDEHLTDPAEAETTSALLQAEIERPRVGPMRDIVATIQPEQDEIVRAGIGGTVCVQGAPGTGKTAVGLHRVAYLLYAHRERLARSGTLVIGPNRSFLQYIEQVLPALGELEVKQATIDDLVGHVEVRGADDAAAAMVKGDARMAEVLRRAVRSHVTLPQEPCVVVRGSRRWRIPAYELEEIVRELQDRDIRYGAAREALPQRIAHAVLVRMEQAGEAPDDRVQDAVARNAAVKAAVKAIWPPVDPAKLVLRLLGDAEFLAAHADGLLSEEEQKTILWAKPPRGAKSAAWSSADAVLIDEAMDLVARTHSLGHVVLDEAQDLSPMQYRAVGRRCTTGSATVLGDIAQGTTPWATDTWQQALAHLGKPGSVVEELTQGFRVPREVIAYASRLLPAIAPDLKEATSIRESAGDFEVRAVEPADLDATVLAACHDALAKEGSIGLIAADARIPVLRAALEEAGISALSPGAETSADARLTLVPATLAKGLEYDYVVLDEPAAVVDGEPDERTGLRRLYVCLTRPVSGLTIVHAAGLPEQLGAA
ncbi:AAA family ATPase [Streptomyces noursei]|uniref:DNA helicase n=1 Tax=Streptomyces noursei TaxID=1971 RepID=A0A401R5S9_STRNR|nr:AAA family ATPase [Streptomyces noursei]AKA05466.1 ATPase AAA [Streptomyces noursei ZPM]EOT00494.1 ATPase AAA [Streptomyces noursei CCRC 11814]EXU85185.1 ATPase AAA [Streptomyces noursei PD-1]UWS73867.1 AAA family ATPase [Streptomyces noursei]GCB92958.1 DNA helicase [Streptomyces noursei]